MVFDLPELNSFHIHGLWKTFLHLKPHEVPDADASPPLHSALHFPLLSLELKTQYLVKNQSYGDKCKAKKKWRATTYLAFCRKQDLEHLLYMLRVNSVVFIQFVN